jgi:hypothetical protein
MWGYVLGVSQNIVAAFLAVATHHVMMVKPMLDKHHQEVIGAQEAGEQAGPGSPEEGAR